MGERRSAKGHVTVALYDLGCMVPYYTGPLCRALEARGVDIRLLSIAYHLDPGYFKRIRLEHSPGCIDVIGKAGIRSRALRRILKTGEYLVNLAALVLRLGLRPPRILHVQQLPLAERGLPVERWFISYLKRRGVRVVHTVHDQLPHDTGDRHHETYRRIYSLADGIICHTAKSKEQVARDFGLDPMRISVIPHGPLAFLSDGPASAAAIRSAYGIPPSASVVLWQGIIKPYKGVPFLLEAWRMVQDLGKNAFLVVAGTGEPALLCELEEQRRALGIERSVRFDFRFLSMAEVAACYEASDILVYPYKSITMSGALMTGITFGKAIVATRLPTFEQVLRDGKTALLVDYADTAGMARALTELLEDDEKRARLGAAAVASLRASGNSWENIAEATEDCYGSALSL